MNQLGNPEMKFSVPRDDPAFAGGLTSAASDSQSGVCVCNCRGLSVF
jgi:hypothetical protein